jgi:hypothetical protein
MAGDLMMGTVAERLLLLVASHGDRDEEISFPASHFSELASREMSRIASDIGLISEILSHESLVVTDEDSLVSFLAPLAIANSVYFPLFSRLLRLRTLEQRWNSTVR